MNAADRARMRALQWGRACYSAEALTAEEKAAGLEVLQWGRACYSAEAMMARLVR